LCSRKGDNMKKLILLVLVLFFVFGGSQTLAGPGQPGVGEYAEGKPVVD
jgi:hypothetical protein